MTRAWECYLGHQEQITFGELGRRVYDIGKVSNSSINIHQTSKKKNIFIRQVLVDPLTVKVELLIFNY